MAQSPMCHKEEALPFETTGLLRPKTECPGPRAAVLIYPRVSGFAAPNNNERLESPFKKRYNTNDPWFLHKWLSVSGIIQSED